MEIFESYKIGEKCLLISADFHRKKQLNASVSELNGLVKAAGWSADEKLLVSRNYPDPKYFIGRGKLDEAHDIIKNLDLNLVIFNHAITPAQQRNIEQVLECKVIDRTRLILEIFSQRAKTHEGRLQVELAQLNYAATRLVKGWTHLERQKGGIGLRGGPGETQLELDRRMLNQRISFIEERLEKVKKQRRLGRTARLRSNLPTIALVGYTNAGKSTLFNKLTGANVLVKDQLFATLDPTLRKISVPKLGEVVLSDTVGFIRNLPHDLVNAFCATLEEAVEADLLLHVIDFADENHIEYMAQVDIVLEQIGVKDKTVINVYNKIDLLDDVPQHIIYNDENRVDSIWLSAVSSVGIDLLFEAVARHFHKKWLKGVLRLDPKYAKMRSELYNLKVVDTETISENGEYLLTLNIAQSDLSRLLMNDSLDFEAVFLPQ